MDKKMIEKIQELLDSALKMSTLLMVAFTMNPKGTEGTGITVDDILYFNKTYYDVREYLKDEKKKRGENE